MFDYHQKLISIDSALSLVKTRDHIVVGLGPNEPQTFLAALHHIADRVTDVTITSTLALGNYEYLSEPYIHSFWIDSWFLSPALRKAQPFGRVNYLPCHLSNFVKSRCEARDIDIVITLASMPDENGRVRFATGNTYEKGMGDNAKLRIAEISPNVPHVPGDNYWDWDEIDYVIESDAKVPEAGKPTPSEKDKLLAANVAALIQDGDCLQLGIGAIPNAVCDLLLDRKDLGVHTEMMTPGMAELMKAGVVTGAHKKFGTGKAVAAFGYGDQAFYDFISDNNDIFMMSGHIVNDPAVIARNPQQVSINMAMEVEITGQVCSESIGHRQFSGTGGQADTAIGARRSPGGRSIIAMPSVLIKKDRKTGEVQRFSKIVSQLKPGAVVSLSRNDADWVVTENGAVCLWGLSIAERVRKLISVAHPDFQEDLMRDAVNFGFIPLAPTTRR